MTLIKIDNLYIDPNEVSCIEENSVYNARTALYMKNGQKHGLIGTAAEIAAMLGIVIVEESTQ